MNTQCKRVILPRRSIWFYVLALATVALRQRRVGACNVKQKGTSAVKGRDLPAPIASWKVPGGPHFPDSKGTR